MKNKDAHGHQHSIDRKSYHSGGPADTRRQRGDGYQSIFAAIEIHRQVSSENNPEKRDYANEDSKNACLQGRMNGGTIVQATA
jgi:hypothetical protein